ncbi:UDP-N-acetylmuramate dehydrogenase [Natranaerobius thermophilus]|nr:UDP-N-acetylmuramate dehydrogenase [Natranaerobius thermophilus]
MLIWKESILTIDYRGDSLMNTQAIYDELLNHLPKDNIKLQHELAPYTTFKIGGPAELFVTPSNIEEVQAVLNLVNQEELPYFVLGNASNVLIDDNGLSGIVIYLGETFKDIQVEGTEITAQSGVSLNKLSRMALKHGLTGLEFAEGIPGTLGGGLYMNAGAFGGQLSNVVKQVTAIVDHQIQNYTRESMDFGYRSSTFQNQNAIILQATLALQKGDFDQIKSYMEDLKSRRTEKQPLNYPSAGSVFKRPEGYYAGKLIEDSGLKGVEIGGAKVSEKHCGFIINTGTATSRDVKELVSYIQKTVKEKFGVTLERELKYL